MNAMVHSNLEKYDKYAQLPTYDTILLDKKQLLWSIMYITNFIQLPNTILMRFICTSTYFIMYPIMWTYRDPPNATPRSKALLKDD